MLIRLGVRSGFIKVNQWLKLLITDWLLENGSFVFLGSNCNNNTNSVIKNNSNLCTFLLSEGKCSEEGPRPWEVFHSWELDVITRTGLWGPNVGFTQHLPNLNSTVSCTG